MKELELFWKTMAEGLRLLARGFESVANQVETASKMQPAGAAKADAAKPQPTAAAKAHKPAAPGQNKATAIAAVYALIAAAPDGIKTADLAAATGFNTKKIQNVIFKLKKQGKITTHGKGVYVVV